ncbi:hypothetical protein [Blastopirellula marina]|uniref:Uncharacterized protein n=1 Tax=Blastopirellula marina DSM 3645 TaxID=314230 RepID=A3ZU91_9BACT|nr:hypothetical protein [Blastopirellula marina]EAQ79793.1 hypothetical protein DSM3645_21674 [Blastopirellula marina DSM 3645]
MPVYEVVLKEKKYGRRHQWRHEFPHETALRESIDLENHEIVSFREIPPGTIDSLIHHSNGQILAQRMLYLFVFAIALLGAFVSFAAEYLPAILITTSIVIVMAIPFVRLFVKYANALWS